MHCKFGALYYCNTVAVFLVLNPECKPYKFSDEYFGASRMQKTVVCVSTGVLRIAEL